MLLIICIGALNIVPKKASGLPAPAGLLAPCCATGTVNAVPIMAKNTKTTTNFMFDWFANEQTFQCVDLTKSNVMLANCTSFYTKRCELFLDFISTDFKMLLKFKMPFTWWIELYLFCFWAIVFRCQKFSDKPYCYCWQARTFLSLDVFLKYCKINIDRLYREEQQFVQWRKFQNILRDLWINGGWSVKAFCGPKKYENEWYQDSHPGV